MNLDGTNIYSLGSIGVVLSILFFIIRYFVSAMTRKDEVISQQYKELKELTIKNIESTDQFTKAITENTVIGKVNMDNLTKLIVEIIKQK